MGAWFQPFAVYSHLEVDTDRFDMNYGGGAEQVIITRDRDLDIAVGAMGVTGRTNHQNWYIDFDYARLAINDGILLVASGFHDKDPAAVSVTSTLPLLPANLLPATVAPSLAPIMRPTLYPTLQPSARPTTATPTRARTPTHPPTTAPSPAPSGWPTGQPSAQPSRQPSAQPSTQPSTQPTGQPSRQPTGQPTTEPTMYVNYANDPVWRAFNATSFANAQDQLGVSFGAAVFKDSYSYTIDGRVVIKSLANAIGGTAGKDLTKTLVCPAWRRFATSSLQLPFDNVFYSSVTVSGMSRSFRSGKITRNSTAITCASDDFKAGVVKTLSSFFSRGKVSDGPQSFTCSGVVWRYQKCQGADSPVLCVNCAGGWGGNICSRVPSNASSTCWGSSSKALEPVLAGYPAVFINPCQDSCKAIQRETASSFNVKFGASLVPMYPLFNSLVAPVSGVTKTSITIVANTTLEGTVTCAPFYGGSVPRSFNDVRSAGFSSQTSTPNSLTTIVISQMQPETDFSVFCATQDLQSNFMDIATITSTGAITGLQTQCCRAAVWTATTKMQKEASDSTDPALLFTFRYTLQTPPTKLTTVSHSIVVNSTGSEACSLALAGIQPSAVAKPSSAVFVPNSGVTQASFSIIGTPGCYFVSLVVASGGTTYEVPKRFAFGLKSSTAQPADPSILSAQFSANGANLVLSLDSPTDMGASFSQANPGLKYDPASAFNCSVFLSFPGSALGARSYQASTSSWMAPPVCFWASSQQIVAQLGSSSVVPGDDVKLHTYKLKPCPVGLGAARCRSLQYATGTARAFIDVSPLSDKPVVALNAAKSIGACDSAQINAFDSRGNAGRAWRAVTWAVSAVSTDPDKTVDRLTISRHLNGNYGARNFSTGFDRVVVIPSSLEDSSGQSVMIAGRYTISLTLTNFLGMSSTGAVTFSIQDNWLPLVLIQGPSTVSLSDTSSPLSLSATATIPACAAQKLNFTMSYTWAVFSGLSPYPVYSSSVDPKSFALPRNSQKLKGGNMYTIMVTSAPNTPRLADHVAFAAITVQVGLAPLNTLVVEFDGLSSSGSPSTRTLTRSEVIASKAPIRLRPAFQDFDLLDKNYYFAAGANSILSYGWTCIKTFPFASFGQDCGLPTNSSYQPSAFAFEVPVAFVSDVTEPRLVLKFSVSTRAIVAGFTKTSAAEFTLTIRSDAVPKVDPTPTKLKYNAEDKIVLNALVTVVGSASTVSWSSTGTGSSNSSGLSLSSIAAVQTLSTSLPASTTRFQQMFELPIKPYSLNPGMAYSFTLTAQYSLLQIATATFSVLINAPPSGGVVSVRNEEGQTNGTAMVTAFAFKTFNWVDDSSDMPISYVLSTYTTAGLDVIVIKPLSTVSFVDTIFPPGLESNGFMRFCDASASDALGASATAPSVSIVVKQPSLELLASSVESALGNLLSSGDTAALYSTVTAASSTLNMVNCTLAPEKTCTKLNRGSCMSVPNTCEACLPGFVGPSGPGMKQCIDMSSLMGSRRGRRLDTLAFLVGAPCDAGNNGDDCLSGYCDSVTSKCQDSAKSCPADCSGQGVCRWFDPLGEEVGSERCLSNDMCFARCSCSEGWHGAACDKGDSKALTSFAMIEKLCAASYQASGSADVTRDSLLQQASVVSSLLMDPAVVSEEALRNCTRLLAESIIDNPEAAAASSGSAESILGALDNMIGLLGPVEQQQLQKSSVRDLLEVIQQATNALAGAVQDTLGINENPVESIQANMRAKTLVVDPGTLVGAAVPFASSDLDKILEKAIPVVSVVSAVTAQDGEAPVAVGLTLVQYTNNPLALNLSTGALPVTISFGAFQSESLMASAAPSRRRRLVVGAAGSDEGQGQGQFAVASRAVDGPSVVGTGYRGLLDSFDFDAALSSDFQVPLGGEALQTLEVESVTSPLLRDSLTTPHKQGRRLVLAPSTSSHTFAFTVVLPNLAPISYVEQTSAPSEVVCPSAGAKVDLPEGCGASFGSQYTCTEPGKLRFECATKSFTPSCVVQSGSDSGSGSVFSEIDTVCRKIAYTQDTTTCSCTTTTTSDSNTQDANRRSRKLAVAQTGADGSVTVGTLGVITETSFTSTFISNPPTPAPTTAANITRAAPTQAPTEIFVSMEVVLGLSGMTVSQAQQPAMQAGLKASLATLIGVDSSYLSITGVYAARRRLEGFKTVTDTVTDTVTETETETESKTETQAQAKTTRLLGAVSNIQIKFFIVAPLSQFAGSSQTSPAAAVAAVLSSPSFGSSFVTALRSQVPSATRLNLGFTGAVVNDLAPTVQPTVLVTTPVDQTPAIYFVGIAGAVVGIAWVLGFAYVYRARLAKFCGKLTRRAASARVYAVSMPKVDVSKVFDFSDADEELAKFRVSTKATPKGSGSFGPFGSSGSGIGSGSPSFKVSIKGGGKGRADSPVAGAGGGGGRDRGSSPSAKSPGRPSSSQSGKRL